MGNALETTRSDGPGEATFDRAVLEQILDLGGAELRAALLEQLLTDFNRISEALAKGSGDEVAAAAHELKGLAATIGAQRLAQLSKRLNTVAVCALAAELDEFRAPVEGEIRIVLETLSRHADRVQS